MTKIRRPEWPKELNSPFWTPPAAAPAHVPFGALAAAADGFAEQERSEVQRRIRAVAKQVGCKNPESWNEEWADLIRGICNYWNIPGFHPPKKRATKQIWTNHKLCELFADVHSLTIAGRLTPNGACGHIADFPAKFGDRYPLKDSPKAKKALAKTLYRQYVAVKNKIKSNARFRHSYFGTSLGVGILNQSTPDFGPDLYRVAIARYASKAPPKVA
jgi:hypothetical protein